jgi:hypothetical protein
VWTRLCLSAASRRSPRRRRWSARQRKLGESEKSWSAESCSGKSETEGETQPPSALTLHSIASCYEYGICDKYVAVFFYVGRRREEKRLKRETAEKERWDGVRSGIEKSVNSQYGYKPTAASEAEQVWAPDPASSSSASSSSLVAGSIMWGESMRGRGSGAGAATAGKGIGSTRSEKGSVALTLRSSDDSSRRDDDSDSADGYSEGKRWRVAEKKKSSVYSLNPLPGIGEVSMTAPGQSLPFSSKVVTISRHKS